MAYQIRQGRLEDVTDLAEVEAACFPAAEAADEESLKERMTAFPECFFVAEEKTEDGFGKIIGFINGAAVDQKCLKIPDGIKKTDGIKVFSGWM